MRQKAEEELAKMRAAAAMVTEGMIEGKKMVKEMKEGFLNKDKALDIVKDKFMPKMRPDQKEKGMKMKDFLPTAEELVMMGPKEKNAMLEKLKYVKNKIEKE